MIYRRWSLLTGPPAILGGIVASVVVANFIYVDHCKAIDIESHNRSYMSPTHN